MRLFLCIGIIILFSACQGTGRSSAYQNLGDTSGEIVEVPVETLLSNNPQKTAIQVSRDVTVNNYFHFMDSLMSFYDTILPYPFDEYILVHANSWIIDTLKSFDYYEKKKKGIFIPDQRILTVLHRGDILFLPDSTEAMLIKKRLHHTVIDVNIPEYRLRIWVNDTLIHSFPVRVGRNESEYLKTAGRVVNLRTPIGEGLIVRVARNPYFVNPVNGRSYSRTKRDDGKYTRMPQIPWLEPMINGQRQGALIHPTTNPVTLGKAYSHGCVGTGEGDAWIIYYNAPIGTAVRFRYDLELINEQGDTLQLKDIYRLQGDPAKRLSSSAGTNSIHGSWF